MNQERNMHRSSTVYKRKLSKTVQVTDFDLRGQPRMDFFLLKEVLWWIMDWDFGQNYQYEVKTILVTLYNKVSFVNVS